MNKLLDELYDAVMESMLVFGGEDDTKRRMAEVLQRQLPCKSECATKRQPLNVFEDGYGDDGLPVYRCPDCFVEIGEHQDVCKSCKQTIIGW